VPARLDRCPLEVTGDEDQARTPAAPIKGATGLNGGPIAVT
jgi:hypothetical protein